MSEVSLVDDTVSSRDLVRTLRVSASRCGDMMPESLVWQAFIELRRRGHEGASTLFLDALRTLHKRRSIAGSDLSTNDALMEEHRLANDQLLGELWKAYKKCLKHHRTGPAGQLLKEIEERLAS
jgi:hypothetical protein